MKSLVLIFSFLLLTPALLSAGDKLDLCDKVHNSDAVLEVNFKPPHPTSWQNNPYPEPPSLKTLQAITQTGVIQKVFVGSLEFKAQQKYPKKFPVPFVLQDPDQWNHLLQQDSFNMMVFVTKRALEPPFTYQAGKPYEWGLSAWGEEALACEGSAHYSYCADYPNYVKQVEVCLAKK